MLRTPVPKCPHAQSVLISAERLDSGIFRILRDEKVQKLPARLISSELSAHQMSPSGVLRTSGVVPHSSSWTTSAYELRNPQMHPRCRRVTSGSAGYDCVNNATVCEGRRPKNRPFDSDPGLASRRGCVLTAIASRPEAVGWAPSVCAGPLTTSLRGLWVSGLLPPGNGGQC